MKHMKVEQQILPKRENLEHETVVIEGVPELAWITITDDGGNEVTFSVNDADAIGQALVIAQIRWKHAVRAVKLARGDKS